MTLPTQFKQWLSDQNGIDKLYQSQGDLPELGNGDVLVKIHAVSLNYRDTEVCMGDYGHHKSIDQNKSIVPCSDMCGTVVKVGPGAAGSWKEGQRVASIFNQDHQTGQVREQDLGSGLGLPQNGVLAEYRVFPHSGLVAVPDYLSDEEAATLPIAAVTAWMSMNWMQPIGSPIVDSEATVLLQGTGGVAISGLQIAKALGLKTIITSSSDEKLQKARELGADHTINYKSTPNWGEEVLKITREKGANIILECGGAQTLRQSFACITFGGMISSIGYLSGKEDTEGNVLNTNVLALKRNVTLKGILNGPKDRFEEMLKFYEKRQIHPIIDKVVSFSEAKDALQYLAQGSHFGKVVVRFS